MGSEESLAPEAEYLLPADNGDEYILLNDLPVDPLAEDPLGTGTAARGIAEMLRGSAAASPFVVAIDAAWGMGKSSLLRKVEAKLKEVPKNPENKADPQFEVIWFNAWTAEGGDALGGLIKSVLAELNPNIIRRTLKKIIKRKRMMAVTGIALTIALRCFGVSRLLEELWTRLYLDEQSRNKLRADVAGMLADWAGLLPDSPRLKRCMVVFVDDLDRCSDDVVVKVCEAVKLYLDVPGLIFVLGCDQSVLARGVQGSACGGLDDARSYLEKIVQVQYRLPPPDDDAVGRLVDGYAKASKTQDLIKDEVREALVEGCGRNPRKIKRVINSFILEYKLSPGWQAPPLSSRYLLIAILLQHFYTPFYDLIIHGQYNDPIGEFLTYADVRANVKVVRRRDRGLGLASADEDRPSELEQLGVFPSETDEQDPERVRSMLDAKQPEEFSALVGNQRFLALLRSIEEERRAFFLEQLLFHPLVTESSQQLSEENYAAQQDPQRVAIVISRRSRVRTDNKDRSYGEVGGPEQYEADRLEWPIGKEVREMARYAIIAVDGTVRRVYRIDPDGWEPVTPGKWAFHAIGDRECTAAEIDAAYEAGDLPLRPGDDCPTRAGGAYRPHWF